jgi:hypothetical protein
VTGRASALAGTLCVLGCGCRGCSAFCEVKDADHGDPVADMADERSTVPVALRTCLRMMADGDRR